MKTTHIIVDMLYDFIDGSLACANAENAVKESVNYINNNPEQKVLYVCDCHPANHCSFKEFGGIWPAHCVKDTHGSAIHSNYYQIENNANRPDENNKFYKGYNSNLEQYSGYEAVSGNGIPISDAAQQINPDKEVIISGIATEFCVKETVMDFLKNGFKVTLLKDALGYVDQQGHLDTLAELEQKGVTIA